MAHHLLNLAHLRASTPGLTPGLGVYLNNAGASLPDRTSLQAMHRYLDEEACIGGYALKAKYAAQWQGLYHALARLIGAQAHEIAITENASAAYVKALQAVNLQQGDRVVASSLAYGTNYLNLLHLQQQRGIELRVLPVPDTEEALHTWQQTVDERVRLISLTHMPTNSGTIAPTQAVGDLARKFDVPFLLDACQTAGQLPLDVKAIGCDLLCATSRKYLRGPRGLGFLFVSDRMVQQLTPAVMDMINAEWTAADEFRFQRSASMFENWEKPFALMMGLKVAVEQANALGLQAISQRIISLAAYLRAQLRELPGVAVHDEGAELGGIVSFTKTGCPPELMQASLAEKGITTSVSGKASTWFDMHQKGLAAINRASVHYYNTREELEVLLKAVRQA